MSRKQPPHLRLDRGSWRIIDGKTRIRTGCAEGDHRGAEEKLAQYIARKYQPAPGPDPLIADVLLHYSKTKVPLLKAKQNTDYNLSNLAAWWGERKSSEVTPATCRSYADTKRPTAARRDLETLRAALQCWIREFGGTVPRIELPPRPEGRERWLTRAEAKKLRLAARRHSHLYRFVMIGLLTGTRSGAILRMTWEWVDLESCIMRRRDFLEAEDKRKRTPPVRISRRLSRLMRRWKRDGSPYVIHYHGKPILRIKKAFKAAVKEAGLKGVTPHTLRHTRATWLMQAGIDPWEAAQSLGMSMEILTRVYAKHHPDFQKRAAEV